MKESAPDKVSLLKVLEVIEHLKGSGNFRLVAMEDLELRVGFKVSKIQVALIYLEKLGFLKRWHNVPSKISVSFRKKPNEESAVQSELYTQLKERRVTDILSFCQEIELSPRTVMQQLAELQNEGHLQYWGKDDLMLIELLQDSELFSSLSENQMGLGDYFKFKRSKIDKMVRYAVADGCRMKVIRDYFGEKVSEDYRCSTCDRCNP